MVLISSTVSSPLALRPLGPLLGSVARSCVRIESYARYSRREGGSRKTSKRGNLLTLEFFDQNRKKIVGGGRQAETKTWRWSEANGESRRLLVRVNLSVLLR